MPEIENNDAKPAIKADKNREYKEIVNAWRYYDEDDRRIYRTDLFTQFGKKHINVTANAEDKTIEAECGMIGLDTKGSCKLEARATIKVDFEADWSGIRSSFDEDRELVIAVPKKVVKIPVE